MLVPAADPIPDPERGEGGVVRFLEENRESVREGTDEDVVRR